MRERMVEALGVPLCLCSWGPSDGPPVLCVHGLLEHGASWEGVATALAERGCHVVAPDLRGHGRSGHVRSYHLVDFLADLDALVREMATSPVTIVGHSMGAAMAAMLAGARQGRVRALVLIEPPVDVSAGAGGDDTLALHLDYLAAPAPHAPLPGVASAAERLRQVTPSMSVELSLRMAERITEPCEGGVRWRWDPLLRTRAGIAFSGMGGLDAAAYARRIRRITAPITLVHGSQSDLMRPEHAELQRGAMPDARRVTLRGGHNLMYDTPAEIAALVAEML
jgi:pimeloyl-ACP methyl ester carboxylesterase